MILKNMFLLAIDERNSRGRTLVRVLAGGSFGEHLVTATMLVVLILGLSLLSPVFLTLSNFLDVARVVAITGIMAVGMTLVILTGGIDLSVGATFALASSIAAALIPGSLSDSPFATAFRVPVPLAVLIGIACGGLVGVGNGFIVAKSKVEPFIVTLGTMTFVRGLTYLFTGGFPFTFSPMPRAFAWVGQGFVFGLPTPTVFFLAVAAVFAWITSRTTLGRSIYAVGGNEVTARLSGLRVDRVKILTYAMLGCLAAFSGIVLASRVGAASATAGVGYELDVIAGVVIGGTSLQGGRGSILGTILGVFILGIITNGLNLLGVSTYYQFVIKGLLLILAVGADGFMRKRQQA